MIRPGLVSVIIAVYNRPQLLVEAVDSALAQSYRPIEILIVDDGSTDETPAVAQQLADRSDGVVRCLRHDRNRFCPDAWNTGVSESHGEFVQFLDSDDRLYPDKFALQVAALRADPQCGISYGWIDEHPIDAPRTGRPARRTGETFATLFPALLFGKIWPSPSPLYRRSLLDANGPFLSVRVQPDWEFDARLGALGVRLHHCRAFVGETRGTHAREGRRKGGVPAGHEAELVDVLERVAAYARAAGVGDGLLQQFSWRLFEASRVCATRGNIAAARRAASTAASLSRGPLHAFYRGYARAAELSGWQAVATSWDRVAQSHVTGAVVGVPRLPIRAARYAGRRSKEAAHFLRGKMILWRYARHYRRARRAYGAGASRLRDIGVQVMRPGDSGVLSLPADFPARVDRVAAAAAAALADPSQCRFVPALREPAAAAIRAGRVISMQLLDPLALDGLRELCEPLVRELEEQLYGSFVLVDKVYVYRSVASSEVPRASWLWHFDNHPREMLKVMIYLTDVHARSAPFEYVRDRAGAPVPGVPLTPMFGRSRVPSATIDAIVAAGGSREAVTGPRGTVIVFDDNVVHRATVAEEDHRDVLVLQVRPSLFEPVPRIDPRWTGSFRHWAIQANPWELAPRLNAEHA